MVVVAVGRRPETQEGDFGLQILDLSLELFLSLFGLLVALLARAAGIEGDALILAALLAGSPHLLRERAHSLAKPLDFCDRKRFC